MSIARKHLFHNPIGAFRRKADYNNEYNKKHYSNMSLRLKPEDFNMIESYCDDMRISKTSFIVSACRFIIENQIPPSEYMKNKRVDT